MEKVKKEEEEEEKDIPVITSIKTRKLGLGGNPGGYKHPRICWHSHDKKMLFASVGNKLFQISNSTIKRLNEHFYSHDSEISDISTCSWMDNLVLSSSVDGKVKVWNIQPGGLSFLYEFDGGLGNPIGCARFLKVSSDPTFSIIVTMEVLSSKLHYWASSTQDMWGLPLTSPVLMETTIFKLRDDKTYLQAYTIPERGLIIIGHQTTMKVIVMSIFFQKHKGAASFKQISREGFERSVKHHVTGVAARAFDSEVWVMISRDNNGSWECWNQFDNLPSTSLGWPKRDWWYKHQGDD